MAGIAGRPGAVSGGLGRGQRSGSAESGGKGRLLAAVLVALALAAVPGGAASASPGAHPAASPAVNAKAGLKITGTITWKRTYLFSNGTESDQNTWTGTFKVDMISTKLPYKGHWSIEDGSTYDVSHSGLRIITDPGCTFTTTGHVTGKGAFSNVVSPWSALDAFWWGDRYPLIGLDIGVQKIETQTTVKSGPAMNCSGSWTTTKAIGFGPVCYKQHPSGLGAFSSGDFNGKDDTVNMDCSGNYSSSSNGTTITQTYKIAGTLHIGAYMFVLPRGALPATEWRRVLTKPHDGYPAADIPVREGTPFYAVTAGQVRVYSNPTCGPHAITLTGMDDVHYTYCHASKAIVANGAKVPPGTELGLTGHEGSRSTGPHLHFEIRINNVQRCPQDLLWALYDGTNPPPDAHSVDNLPETGCFYVDVIVNNKTVRIDGKEATGLEIKQAAIRQGVHIKSDYHLAEIGPGGQRIRIGDADKIKVHDKEKFIATAP